MTNEQRLKQIREAAKYGGVTPNDVDFLFSLVDSQVAEDGYWPTLLDRGDGVRDHFCIGRLIKPGEIYWEFWNKGQWLSAGEVFIGREAAQTQLDKIRNNDTLMRSACIEKVKEFDNWVPCKCSECRADAHGHAVDVHASLFNLATELESVEIQEQKS